MYNTLDPIMDEQVLKEQLGLLVPLVSFLLSDQKGLNRTGGPDNSAEHNGLFLLSFLGIDMGPLVAAFFQRCGSHCRARDTDPRHAGGRLAPGHCGTITHCNWTSSERAQPAWRWSACLHSSLALVCLFIIINHLDFFATPPPSALFLSPPYVAFARPLTYRFIDLPELGKMYIRLVSSRHFSLCGINHAASMYLHASPALDPHHFEDHFVLRIYNIWSS
ncbi:hypothetical protein B0F90DRAFT_306193 [Multifurca ochricompacta]|uniref:Uncharacterized protein n=1 Tax=Multifurca ochricompacta TaxID=376703 RepID=A0AAD4LVQ8_9AGAM|nr:hypothetical protein B0F90DRAFT_306193 [Multifurca ochricompacta]